MKVESHVDYDIHGLVGIRLINPTAGDAAAVARQLGPLQGPLSREPDIIVRFVDHLPTSEMRYLGLGRHGFTNEGYFVLRSSKRSARVRVAFDQIGTQCEIVCESGLRSVPLLVAILNLTALKADCAALHASAFIYEDIGILAAGWAKGGKTESLLAFAARGATYVGDEWVLLSGDGKNMYGIPENIRLWDWHLDYLPRVRSQVGRERRLLFKSIKWLDGIQKRIPGGRVGEAFPIRYIREAMPALKRQLNITVNPQDVFGNRFGPFIAKPSKVFLLVSHESSDIDVEACDSLDISRRMMASIRYELLPFWEHYLAFRFAFPERRNDFIERAEEIHYDILCRALAGKEAYIVRHPYPVSLGKLYEAMSPFCSSNGRHT